MRRPLRKDVIRLLLNGGTSKIDKAPLVVSF